MSSDTFNIVYKNKYNFNFLNDIDDYKNRIKYKRTKIEREDYKLKIWSMIKKLNQFKKPNEIIIFTNVFEFLEIVYL